MNDLKNLSITFDARSLDIVVNALGQRPYLEVAGVLADISTQIQRQQSQEKGPLGGGPDSLPEAQAAAPTH